MESAVLLLSDFLHTVVHFKGTVARDCRPLVFFHESTPYGPLIHTVKYFRIRIRRYIRICMCISTVGYSADSNFI